MICTDFVQDSELFGAGIKVLCRICIERNGNGKGCDKMRITNKIMQNNNLSNINTNKIMQDKLSNQMSTQKKVNRPSDDPVVAIRALRLRSNVTEVTQYYSKNIPDAESWLSVTEDALKNLSQVVTNMISQCTKGANGDLTSADREIVIEQLKGLAAEVYSTGDADYAGRYVFTGYRTDTSLSFFKDEKIKYTITEQIDNTAIDEITVINTFANTAGGKVDLTDLNSTNYQSIAVTENDVQEVKAYRIRLAYNSCDDGMAPSITYKQKQANGTYADVTMTATTIHSYDDPYSQVGTGNPVVFVPETGELLLDETSYNKLMTTKDDSATATVDEGEIRVTYQKSQWVSGDLRPQHYFYCTSEETQADGSTKTIEYNAAYLNGVAERQSIEYDVGFNQTIRVNSTADECFQHGIGREVDDLVNAMQEVVDMEGIVANLEGMLETATGTDKDTIQSRLDAANKALTLKKNKAQKLFESGITKMQGYLDSTNLSITNCGTRSSKLELIEKRMQTQKTTYETLKSNNEDVDITEVAIQLTSSQLTYQAALMATGKVAQTTLLNYI